MTSPDFLSASIILSAITIRFPELQKLGRQVKIAFYIRRVHDIQNCACSPLIR